MQGALRICVTYLVSFVDNEDLASAYVRAHEEPSQDFEVSARRSGVDKGIREIDNGQLSGGKSGGGYWAVLLLEEGIEEVHTLV